MTINNINTMWDCEYKMLHFCLKISKYRTNRINRISSGLELVFYWVESAIKF